MDENRQALIEMISRTKDNKRMNVLIKQYIHLYHPNTLLTNVLVNLVNDIIENERKEDNKMQDINFKNLFNATDVNISYNEEDLILDSKFLMLMNGLKNEDTQNTDLYNVFKSINEKLTNDIKVSGIEENKSLVGDIKTFIILKLYLVCLYDFINFSLEKNSPESSQILNILDREYNNDWKGARLSD